MDLTKSAKSAMVKVTLLNGETMERLLDLNIFYREGWTEGEGSTWASTFTIEPYIRTYDDNGAVYNTETGVLIECDEFETEWLSEQFPANEYGDDFWIFADEVVVPSRRIKKVLESISLSPGENAAQLTYTGPTTM